MSDTIVQVRKSPDVSPLGRLCRMLQSMLRRYPSPYLQTTVDGFGVRLGDGRFLRIVYNGHWSDEDLRDFLVLFATWLAADPAALHNVGIPLDGVLQRARVLQPQSPGPPISGSANSPSRAAQR